MADKYLKETIQIPQVTPQDVVNATELFKQESQNPKSVILKNGALYAANNLLGFANHALREDDYLNDLKKYYRTNELDQKVDRSPLDRAVNYAGGYDWGMQSSVNDENLQDAINAARAYQLRDYVNSETDKRRNDAIKDYLENIAGMKAAMADKEKGIERDRNDIVNDAVIFSGRQNYAQGGDVDTDSIDSAMSDYSQLLEAYPNARKFLSNVQDLREKNNFSPDDSQIASAILHPIEFAKRAGDKFNKNVNTLMGVRTVEPDSNIDIYGYTPQEQAESALNLAGLAGTGAMPFNSAGGPGTAGMFLGMQAKNAPLDKFDAAKALANEYGLRDAKVGSPEWMNKNKDIWSKTGIHYGYDMNPRFEISDLPFKVKTIGDFRNLIDESEANIAALSDESKVIRQAKKEKTPQTDLFEKELAKSRNQRLKDIEAEKESIQNEINKPFGIDYGANNASTFANIAFQHPEFFNNYSQIGNDVVVGFTPRIGGGGRLHNNKLDIFSDRDNPEARLTGIHELQHAIQRLEDWNRGGSPEVAPLIHHEIARQSLENALPKTKANYFEAQQLMDQSSPLRKVSYIHDLENIKQPRDLFNTDSWYKNSERVRDIIGSPPKYGSRLPYAQEAGKILAKFELADAPYDATQLYHSGAPREEIRRQLRNIDSKLNRRWDDWRSYNELLKNVSRTNPRINKFSDSDAYDMYKNLAGEAEARATEARLNLTPEERSSRFPLEDYDVKNPLVHYLSNVRSPANYAEGGSVDTDVPNVDEIEALAKRYDPDFVDRLRSQRFGLNDSAILSSLANPPKAIERELDKLLHNVQVVSSPYSTIDEGAASALDLAGLMQTGSMPFAPNSSGGVLGTFSIPKRKITVNDPVRVAYPEIYDRPDEIARRAAQNVAEEDPAMKRLFGVTRDDLYELRKSRLEGNEAPNLVMPANPKGAKIAPQVMTRRNAQRIIDTLSEAEKYPELYKGMDAWYEMGPLFERYKQISDDPVRDFKRFQIFTGMASPGSDVLTEINRGTAALNLANQKRFEDFLKYAGKPFSARIDTDFPEYLAGVMGHPYHSTAHGKPISKYVQTGNIEMESPKVPLYIQSVGVPETGFQIDLPVGDAHWSRGVGLADVRTSKDYGASVSMPELLSLGPWWSEKIAKPLGTNAVNAQARAWGTFAPATGVDTPVGAPKLELISQKIMDVARAYGIEPEEARDLLLMGEIYAPNINLLEAHKKAKSGYAQGGSIDTDSPESAISDYSQLLDAYPNANKFLLALKSSVMQHLPSQEDLRDPQYMMDTALNFGPLGLAMKVPENTVKAYKLFRTKKTSPDEIYPLFVNADKPVPMNEWIEAEEGKLLDSGKVASKLGPLAYRPGWHAGDIPVATHIGKGGKPPVYRPDEHVWAEVEFPADVDWQKIANERGINAKGQLVPKFAHITDQIPEGGFYRYKTSPAMTGNWLIGGGMKVNRLLDDAEVKAINEAAGYSDLPRLRDYLEANQQDPAIMEKFAKLAKKYGIGE